MTEVQQGRICPTCGFADNSLQARFCGQCASVLLLACPQCGAANPPGFRFCGQCTAPLSDHAAPATTLRVVTVLFADVCNYTAHLDFFSYRRSQKHGEADYGRQISAIVLR